MIPLAAQQLTGVAGWMTSLIDSLGAAGVGVVIFAETVVPPIPSEVVLPAAGYLSGTGSLNLVATLLWATVGSVLGALLLYGLGAWIGVGRLREAAEKMPLMSATDIDTATRVFGRWQRTAVFFGRLIPGVRSLVSIPAGVERMPLASFVVLTGLGSLLWNALLIGAGFWLGETYGATETVSTWLNTVVYVGLGGMVVWFVGSRIRARVRRSA
ncbi:DedA family protein [Euzebya tangerina]|uniref:DedA family protein n=1 Tax=Euzebya tangerina TaxID=591198 RepID=UPI000E31A28A|nr:DedA family protein [Euzebya tangerina]